MKKIYLLAALTVVAMVLAVASGLVFATGWAEQALKDRAEARMGRSLTISGGAHVEFSPRLALRFDTVDVSNADGLDGAFISAEALRVPMTVSSLLAHQLGDTLEVVNARVGFEISEKGDVSWALSGKGPVETADARLTLNGGTLSFFDHRNNQHFELGEPDIAVDVKASGELSLSGSAVISGRRATLTAFLKSLPRVDADGSPFDFSLEAAPLAADFSGRLATATNLNLAGTVSLSGNSLRETAGWLGITLPGSLGLGPFAVSGELDGGGLEFTVRQADVALDDMKAKGSVGLTLSGERPQLLADLGLDHINVGAYVPVPNLAASAWSEEPLDYAGLRALDARVALNVNALAYGPFAMGKSAIEATLAAGRFGAIITGEQAMGGSARVDLEADGSAEVPVFSIHVEGQNMEAERLTSALTGTSFLKGPATLSLNVSGFGASTAAIVSTLKGSASLTMAEGAVLGVDGKALAVAVTQRIIAGWQRQEGTQTPFSALSLPFEINDGIAASKDLRLDGTDLAAAGTGNVDLLRQAVDLSLTPKLGAAQLPVAVIIKGPWGAPRIYPDVAEILTAPEQAFAKLKAMGLPAAGN